MKERLPISSIALTWKFLKTRGKALITRTPTKRTPPFLLRATVILVLLVDETAGSRSMRFGLLRA